LGGAFPGIALIQIALSFQLAPTCASFIKSAMSQVSDSMALFLDRADLRGDGERAAGPNGGRWIVVIDPAAEQGASR
jgi:hypothetical protein